MIEWLVTPDDPDHALENLRGVNTLAPFSDEAVEFIHSLSQTILTDPSARDFPELMAMAHWFRKAHLNLLKQRFESEYKHTTAKGTIFHIAPGNVDTLFMYSWLLSVLIGNHNIVRLSQRTNEQIEKLLGYVRDGLAEHPALHHQNFILTYPHQDEITKRLSTFCDVRVIWGGDETVNHIQSIPLPDHAHDVGFKDRFSLAVFNADFMIQDSGFDDFIGQFYNDTFWFDQRACSSPRLIGWVGDEETIAKAREKFWPAFQAYTESKGLPACAGETIARSTVMMHWTALGHGVSPYHTELAAFPAHIMVAGLNDEIRLTHPGTGLFAETVLPSLDALGDVLSAKDQTLTAYGFDDAALQPLKSKIDRICRPGMALAFDTVWDGVDFLNVFTAP